MRRIAIMLAALVLVATGVTVAIGRLSPSEPVYSAAEVQAGLRRNPAAWVGRVILVRGSMTGGDSSNVCSYGFTNRSSASSDSCRQIMTIGIGSSSSAPNVGSPGLSVLNGQAGSIPLLAQRQQLLVTLQNQVQLNHVQMNAMQLNRAMAKINRMNLAILALLNHPSPASPAPNLNVAVSPGVRLPVAGPHHLVPDFLYTLPLVGSQFAHWFPRDNGAIFRVRLNMSPNCWSPSASVTCDDTDGTLLSS